MKIQKYENISSSEFATSLEASRTLLTKIKPWIIKEYFEGNKKDYRESGTEFIILNQLTQLNHVLPGGVRNQKVLDLGCGSTEYPKSPLLITRMYEPWLCRILKKLKANPIGIDIRTNSIWEGFESYMVNLCNLNSLSFLQDNSIDVANAKSLFDSTFANENLKENLIPQLERIVKPEGYFLYFPKEEDPTDYAKRVFTNRHA